MEARHIMAKGIGTAGESILNQTIELAEKLRDERNRLKTDLENCYQQDSMKTIEINILVKEHKELISFLEQEAAADKRIVGYDSHVIASAEKRTFLRILDYITKGKK